LTADDQSDALTVLIVIEAPIATTQIVEQVIGACRHHGIRSFTRLLRELRAEEIGPNVLPLFIRCADPTSLHWAEALVGQGKPYLYYLDDDFWALNDGTPLSLYYSDPGVRRALDFFVGNAAAVLTNSQLLAAALMGRARAVEVLPTFFDFSQLADITVEASDEIRIGFAGSTSRAGDLELVASMIQPLVRQFPHVVFEFVGAMPAGVSAGDRVRFFPTMNNYGDFIRFKSARGWSIGLGPLRDRPANLAKTDNKFREYAACRIAGVFSNLQPYTDVVADGVTGLLVENTADAWREAITSLIADPHRRRSIADAAYQHAREKYDLDRAASTWAEVIKKVSAPLRTGISKAVSADAIRRESSTVVFTNLWLRVRMTYAEGGGWLVARRATGVVTRRLVELVRGRRGPTP
jgi:glycosyltransferase involved in cell wall biosynthesis